MITKGQSLSRNFIEDQDAGAPKFKKLRAQDKEHPIEATGRELRKLMAWMKSDDSDYVEVPPSAEPREPRPPHPSRVRRPRHPPVPQDLPRRTAG